MTTIHEDAAAEALRDFLASEDGAKAFSVYLAGLRTERWSAGYINAIGQTHWHQPERWPLEQIYSFMMVHSLLMDGEVGKVQISTHGEPNADRDRTTNQAALENLPGPFIAHVDPDQHGSDRGDGFLEWTAPIQVEQSLGYPHTDLATGRTAPLVIPKVIPPGQVPLEIGYTLPSKTHDHLLGGRGVARWAYGSRRIHLFVRTRSAKSLL